MKVAVVGAGAMGCIFGTRFTQGGHETVLVDVAAPLVERINADGVTIVREDDETVTRVRATSDPAEIGPVDLVVFLTKCYQTEAAAKLARPLVGPKTVVASLQNGWGNGDVLARAFPAEQLVLGLTYNSGTVLGLARIQYSGPGPTFVGPFDEGTAEGAERLATAIADGDLDVTVATPIRPEIWKKLIINAAVLPTAALTGMNSGELASHEGMRDLSVATAREAISVAQALGYDIDQSFADGMANPSEEGRRSVRRASMLQDFEGGRRTEIDVINGAVVSAGDGKGVPVPVNRALVALVQGWETQRGLR